MGRIQSGPDSKIFSKTMKDQIMNYVPVRQKPWLSAMVLPVKDSFEPSPKRMNNSDEGIICIDMRLELVRDQ